MLSINRNDYHSRKKSVFRVMARMILCLMLTFALVLPIAAPDNVYAASTKYTTAKYQSMAGIDITFSSEVINNKQLSMGPTCLQAAGKSKSIKLSWNAVTNPEGIDGYIIVRRNSTTKRWHQIAAVGRYKTTYTDKKAKSSKKCYRYSVLAYKKVSGKIMVSGPSGYAAAVTKRNKKKNVYSVSVSNPANVSIVMAGSCAQTYLKFPSKAYSRSMRWWSSNDAILKVDSNGLITGVSPGTATVYAKAHTGSISSFNVKVDRPGTAQAMIDTFYAWEGYSRINGKQKGIIDIYNSITPWPAGYKMRYSDAWCDATVSAAAIKTGNVERIGRECSVPRHIKIFKKLGIWEEDGTIVPRPGDIIVYSWNKFRQPNNASASHIGIVAKVEGNEITAIEGNRGIGIVATRTIKVGWGCIRGYARPNYIK